MPKSNISDILEVQRLIGKLDKRGKLAILRDLQRQNLESIGEYAAPPQPSAFKPVAYKEGEER